MNNKIELSDDAKRARREYHRRWRKEHPENIANAQARFFDKLAAEAISDTKDGDQNESAQMVRPKV